MTAIASDAVLNLSQADARRGKWTLNRGGYRRAAATRVGIPIPPRVPWNTVFHVWWRENSPAKKSLTVFAGQGLDFG